MSYSVGQILYVVLRKEANVYPMQVIEEITKRTLEGAVTTYVVRAGSEGKTLALNEIDGEVFDSAERAKVTLIERASQSITQRVALAVSKSKDWYPGGFEGDRSALATLAAKSQTPAATEDLNFGLEEEEMTVMELPDGTKAKVRTLKVPQNLQ